VTRAAMQGQVCAECSDASWVNGSLDS